MRKFDYHLWLDSSRYIPSQFKYFHIWRALPVHNGVRSTETVLLFGYSRIKKDGTPYKNKEFTHPDLPPAELPACLADAVRKGVIPPYVAKRTAIEVATALSPDVQLSIAITLLQALTPVAPSNMLEMNDHDA